MKFLTIFILAFICLFVTVRAQIETVLEETNLFDANEDYNNYEVKLVNNLNSTADLSEIKPGENYFYIDRPEGKRFFYAYFPNRYFNSSKPTDKLNLIFSFHGFTNDCKTFGPGRYFQSYVETYNFIYVYPCSTKGPLGNAWNAGTCCLRGSSVDDKAFALSMINYFTSTHRVSTNKVFTTGFSNGGMMSEILGCEYADKFAGIASVAGVVEIIPGNGEGLNKCDALATKKTTRTNILLIHGTLDLVVPWIGDPVLGFPSIPTNYDRWVSRNKCTGSQKTSFTKGDFSNTYYNTCRNSTLSGKATTVELVKCKGYAHNWPSHSDFSSTKYILEFFQRTAGFI